MADSDSERIKRSQPDYRGFKPRWLLHPTLRKWIVKKDGEAHCKFCSQTIKGGITHMLRHNKSTKHNEHFRMALQTVASTGVGLAAESTATATVCCDRVNEPVNRPRKPLNRKDFGFRKCWLAYTDLKKWMVEKNNHAWCTYCQREVLGDLSDMVWHQTSAEHRQRQGIVTRRPANTVHIVASSSADDEMAGDNDDGSVEDYSVKGARLDNDEESCPRSSSTPTTNTDPDGVVVVYVNHAYVNVNHECNISSEDPLGLENDMHVQPNDCESETDADDRVTDVDEIEEPTDERSTSDSTKPTFNTRFRRSWLQDDRLKTWMLERNGGAYCRFCCVAVSGGITHMHRHETATRHKRLWRKGCSIVELYRAARPSDASCTDVDVSVPTAKQSPSDSNWLTSTRPFKQQWLEDAELKAWMLERDGMAYCRFCCIAIVGGLTHMYRHGATTRHKEQCGKGSSILSNLTDPLDPVPSNNGCSSLIGMRSASSAQNR